MACSDIITLVSAIIVGSGTIALAVMTWKSMTKITTVQQNEFLREIIDWAVQFIELSDKSMIVPAEESILIKHQLSATFSQLGKIENNLKLMGGKSRHVAEIVKNLPDKLKPQDLKNSVNNLQKSVEKYIKTVYDRQIEINKQSSALVNVTDRKKFGETFVSIIANTISILVEENRNLKETADKVIAEASKIQRMLVWER